MLKELLRRTTRQRHRVHSASTGASTQRRDGGNISQAPLSLCTSISIGAVAPGDDDDDDDDETRSESVRFRRMSSARRLIYASVLRAKRLVTKTTRKGTNL